MRSYRSVRGSFRVRTRARKAALPQASLFFLAAIALLAVVFNHVSHHPDSDATAPSARTASPQSPLHSLVATVRSGSSDYGDLCTSGNIFSKKASLAFLIPGAIMCFVGLAIVTDDYFVAALERICERLDLTEDVAGATFMAAGSSTPEFFASLLGVFVTKDEVGIGTIVGSAVFNLLVIIGLSAALAGAVLQLDWRPLMRDSFFYIVSIILLLVFTVPSSSPTFGFVRWWEGLLLVATYVVYVLFMAYGNKRYMKWAARVFSRSEERDVELGAAPDADTAAADAGANAPATANSNADGNDSGRGDADAPQEQPSLAQARQPGSICSIGPDGKPRYRDLNARTRLKVAQYAVIAANRIASSASSSEITDADAKLSIPPSPSAEARSPASPTEPETPARTFLGVDLPQSKGAWLIFPLALPWKLAFRYTIVDCSTERFAKWWWLTFLLSIVWISGISYVMVEAVRITGCLVGIPAAAMGYTVLAAGTSVPDALASVSVARDGAGDMAVSNAIGSNVFDILLGLGLPWLLGDLFLKRIEGDPPIRIPKEPWTRVILPIIILFVIMIMFVAILVLLRWKMRPMLGYLLFGLYGLFLLYMALDIYVFELSVVD